MKSFYCVVTLITISASVLAAREGRSQAPTPRATPEVQSPGSEQAAEPKVVVLRMSPSGEQDSIRDSVERAERAADQAGAMTSVMELQLSTVGMHLSVLNWTLILLGIASGIAGTAISVRLNRYGKDFDSALATAKTALDNASKAEAAATKTQMDAAIALSRVEQHAAEAGTHRDRAVKRAEELVQQVRDSSLQIRSVEAHLAEAMAKVSAAFARKATRVIGTEVPPGSQEMADADTVIVLADQLGLAGNDRDKLAAHFVAAGRAWGGRREYLRAIARLERAAVLKPDLPEACEALSRLFWVRAKENPGDLQKQAWLARAHDETERARVLRGHDTEDTLASLGAICDERGERQEALRHLRGAREISRGRARSTRTEEDWDISYNIACVLAKAGDPSQAIAELEAIVDKTERTDPEGKVWPVNYRSDIAEEREFNLLRLDENYGDRLRKLGEA